MQEKNTGLYTQNWRTAILDKYLIMVPSSLTTLLSKRSRIKREYVSVWLCRTHLQSDIEPFNTIRYGPVDGCMPLAISGSLPKFWDWLDKATEAGKADYMDIDVEVWAGRDHVRGTLQYTY